MRLHSVSLYDEAANVLWLSEGALGPDEHNLVLEAMESLRADTSRAFCEHPLEDGRIAIFLPVRSPQGGLVGIAMILADLKSVGDGVVQRMVTPQMRTIMQKVAVLLRPLVGRSMTTDSNRVLQLGPDVAIPSDSVPADSAPPVLSPQAVSDILEFELDADVVAPAAVHIAAASAQEPETASAAQIQPVAPPVSVAPALTSNPPASKSAPAGDTLDLSDTFDIAGTVETAKPTGSTAAIGSTGTSSTLTKQLSTGTSKVLAASSATGTSRTLVLPEGTNVVLEVQPFSKLRSGGRTRRYEVQARANRALASLDSIALQRLLAWLAANRTAWNSEPTSFTLNLSIATLEDDRFPQFVASTLRSHGIAPDCIGFEIAEPLCLQRRAQVERFFSVCEKLGCFVVIDDFSLDSTALGLLRSKSLRLVKIDSKLTSTALKDKLSQAMVVAIAQAVKVLGIHCAAKRVESQATVQWLTAIGCDFAQGSALAPPQPLESLSLPQS